MSRYTTEGGIGTAPLMDVLSSMPLIEGSVRTPIGEVGGRVHPLTALVLLAGGLLAYGACSKGGPSAGPEQGVVTPPAVATDVLR